LYFSFNTMTSLPDDLFGETSNLAIFEATSCQLTSLPSDLLRNMRNLREFNIRSNSITRIDRNLLVNAAYLEKVDLSDNQISDTSVITDLLSDHGALNSIRVGRNSFASFDFTFFTQFTQLIDLNIGGRPSLTGIDWKGLPASLTEIYVSDIGEEIPSDAFSHLTNLESLGFTGSGVTYLHEDTFRQLVNLDSLGIQSTRLRTIPSNIFVDQTNLTQLYLSHNNIEELPDGLFSNLVNLGFNRTSALTHHLFLSGNRIRRLNANSFGYHPFVRNLNLAFNDIAEIERELFARFPNPMEIVDLTYNNCTSTLFWFDSNLHNDTRLENCFNNWAGITTVSPPIGAADKIKAGFSLFLMAFILISF